MSDVALLKMFLSLSNMLIISGASAIEVIPQRDAAVFITPAFTITTFITITFITIHLHHVASRGLDTPKPLAPMAT